MPIPLRPKTWSVLRYLVERPGELVSREALLDAVWPDVAVTPDTLTKSIGELRVALGEEPRAPRFIETVHGRGFRFIAQTSNAPAFDDTSQTWRDMDGPIARVVGRADELRQLGECFARACSGDRQIVFVTGPPGIGKTTLVEAFLESRPVQALTTGVRIGRGGCVEQHGPREAYMPVLEALDRLARRPDGAACVDLLRRSAPTWLAQLPWLLGDDAEELRRALQAARTDRMLREFATLTEALTVEAPLVLVLEDLHWSDPSTVDLLAVLAQRREPARLLVVGTYRPAEVAVQQHPLGPVVRALRLHRKCVSLPVHGLAEADVRRYLEARFAGADLPPTLVPLLHARTDGNPLFVNALIEHMLSRGWILDTAPGWQFAAHPEDLDLGVPDDARRMIAAQLERLGPADQDLLHAASVVGHDFAAPVVAAALRCGLEEVETRCDQLARAQRFLRAVGGAEWPDGTLALRYAFPHELYRQAVYEALPLGKRQRLHQRVGEALEAAHGERATDIAGELAEHFERAGDARRALHYLRAAAVRAAQRLAGREAIGYLEAAVALTARLPDAAARHRQELDLRLQLAPLVSHHFGFASEAVSHNCEAAHTLSEVGGTPAQRFETLYALCHVYAMRADPLRLPPTLSALDRVARELDSEDYVFLADSATMRTAVHAARFRDACRRAEGPLAARLGIPMSPDPPAYGPDPIVDSRGGHAHALWHLGHADRARTIAHASLAATASGASVFTRSAALGLTGLVETLCRNPAAVHRLSDELLMHAAEHTFPFLEAIGFALRGWARLQLADPQAALPDLTHARDALAAEGARLFSGLVQAFLAEAHLRAGDLDAGLAAADAGLQVAETTLDRCHWPELWRLKGELLLTTRASGAGTSPATEAEYCFERALAVARASEAKAMELRAATSLASHWQRLGRAREAAALLEPLCRWFGSDASSPDLDDARTVLARPPTARARAPRR